MAEPELVEQVHGHAYELRDEAFVPIDPSHLIEPFCGTRLPSGIRGHCDLDHSIDPCSEGFGSRRQCVRARFTEGVQILTPKAKTGPSGGDASERWSKFGRHNIGVWECATKRGYVDCLEVFRKPAARGQLSVPGPQYQPQPGLAGDSPPPPVEGDRVEHPVDGDPTCWLVQTLGWRGNPDTCQASLPELSMDQRPRRLDDQPQDRKRQGGKRRDMSRDAGGVSHDEHHAVKGGLDRVDESLELLCLLLARRP